MAQSDLRKPRIRRISGEDLSRKSGEKRALGPKGLSQLRGLPEPIDVALMLIPAPAIPDVLAEGAANGLKCGLIFAARFGEMETPRG